MKAVMVMFDSLNRRMLEPYGCDWVHTPNFRRLAQRSVTFDRSYVCSMPCMPARRDLHTGRPNFLHRSWGPIEPFDDSMPHMLKQAGVHTHLATDHQHYWEDGGCTFHQRYSTFEFIRGQEGDKWHPVVGGVAPDERAYGRNAAGKSSDNIEWQDRVNRRFMPTDADHPQTHTFAAGLRFLDLNHDADRWFLQIETFDPHEPFFTHRQWKDRYAEHFDLWAKTDGRLWDWPGYEEVRDEHTRAMVEHMRHEYAALVSKCDHHLGEVLDAFDRHNLWEDTMLIVCTDHGFLLGEHDWWAKMRMPWWNELANTPLFVWDPRSGKRGERREALVQPAIDIAPTVLRYFGVEPTGDMTGRDLAAAVDRDAQVREAAIYGVHGGHVNVTDGRYVYMRAPASPDNRPLFEYTLMPTHMKHPFAPAELAASRVELSPGFSFTKGCALLKVGDRASIQANTKGWTTAAMRYGTLLYDLEQDPGQTQPIDDDAVERRMSEHLIACMKACDAPAEQYERLGL